MGFNTLKEDEESNIFSLRLELPIPFSVFGDSCSWGKYGHHILPSNLSLSSREIVKLHDPFWKCLLALLQTDLDGNLIPHQIVTLLPRLNPIYPTSSQVTNITRLVVLILINFCYILQPQTRTTWPNLSRRRQLAQLQFHWSCSPIFASRDFQSIHFWIKHLKFFSNLRSSWNHMKNSFFSLWETVQSTQ